MITKEQIDRLATQDVLAVLTRNYKPKFCNYLLLKGTIVEIAVYKFFTGALFINGQYVDYCFPYDAAELLE